MSTSSSKNIPLLPQEGNPSGTQESVDSPQEGGQLASANLDGQNLTTTTDGQTRTTTTDGQPTTTTTDDLMVTTTMIDGLKTRTTDGQNTSVVGSEAALDVEGCPLAASLPLPTRRLTRRAAIVSDSQSDAGSSVPSTPVEKKRKRPIDQDVKPRVRKDKAKSRKTRQAVIDDVETDHTGDDSLHMDIEEDKAMSQSQRTTRQSTQQETRPLSPKSCVIQKRETEADSKDLSFEEHCLGALGGVTDPNLENLPAETLGCKLMDLAKEIEVMRQKSHNLQGQISGRMKKNLRVIQEGVMVLVGKTLASGDPAILKMQNKELIVRTRELERENGRLKDRLRQSLGGADSPIRKRKVEKATSPKMVLIEETQTEEECRVTERGSAVYPAQVAPAAPPPMPQRQPRAPRAALVVRDPVRSETDTDVLPDKEKVYSRQIEELVALRRLEREKKKKGREKVREVPERLPTRAEARRGPRIVQDIQLVPPRSAPVLDYSTAGPSADEEGWQIAKGGRQRERRRATYAAAIAARPLAPAPAGPVRTRPGVTGTTTVVGPKRRSPRAAVVAITGVAQEFSYAEALRKARANISLENLGIMTPRVRKAANGGILIEVKGEDGKARADKLAAEIRNVLQGEASVTRPSKKGEVRITGLDDSVSPEEVTCVLAGIGDCSPEEIRTGPIRPMRSGLGVIWAQLPLSAAIKAAELGRMRIGWTMAGIRLLSARPIQCFKCWEFGHIQYMCKNTIDRAGACYKCGERGHVARMCANSLRCTLCAERGHSGGHRMGGPLCVVAKEDPKSNRRLTETTMDHAPLPSGEPK